MSIHFQRKQPRDRGEFLPEEASSLLNERSLTTEVRAIVNEATSSTLKPKRKKTEQHAYSEETRAFVVSTLAFMGRLLLHANFEYG